jgi:kumamolisin
MPDDLLHIVTFVLRPPSAAADISQQLLDGTYDVSSASRANLAADPADVKAALAFIQKNGLRLVSENADARTIHASGTVQQLEAAFGVSLTNASGDEGSVEAMHNEEALTMPAELTGPVIAVLGLDQRPIARHHAGE